MNNSLFTPDLPNTFPLAILEHMSEGVSVSTEDGYIVYTNKAEDDLFGYARGELVGKHVTIQNAYPPEDNERIVNEVIHELKSNGVWMGEWHNKRKDGAAFMTFSKITSLEYEGKKFWVCIQEDLSLRKELDYRLADNEHTMRVALAAGKIGVWVWELKTNKIIWSDETYQIHEVERSIDVGEYVHYTQRVYEEDVDRVMKHVNEALEQNKPYDIEFRVLTAKGNLKWVQTRATVLRDVDGKPVKMIGATRDVTRKKNAEISLAKSEETFRTLSASAPVGIFLTDAKGNISYINPRAEEICDITFAEAENRGWASAIHPDDLPGVSVDWVSAIKERVEFKKAIRVRHKNGDIRWVYVRVAPLIAEHGEYLGGTGTIEDITGRILRDQQKDEFLAMASHELKTPVTSIKAYAQLLYKRFLKKGDDVTASLLSKMDDQIDRLTSLISDLLDVSKIQAGKLQLTISEFLINGLLQESIENVQITSDTHTIDYVHDGPLIVTGDRERVGQVITNLLTNAIKYSPQSNRVIVKVGEKNGMALVSVQDFGVGIPKSKQDRLFERFYRVEGEYRETFPGLGLGLYICSEIIRRLQGTIWVESVEGKGSTFFFTIPLAKEGI